MHPKNSGEQGNNQEHGQREARAEEDWKRTCWAAAGMKQSGVAFRTVTNTWHVRPLLLTTFAAEVCSSSPAASERAPLRLPFPSLSSLNHNLYTWDSSEPIQLGKACI